MFVKKLAYGILLTGIVVVSAPAENSGASKEAPVAKEHSKKDKRGPAVLWRDPTDISSRNLFYGPGGKEHRPHAPFVFVKEDLDGTNPKFVVRDQDGVKWKVKMGNEAKPETAATRIAWAVGYYTDEDYFLPQIQVQNMPDRLHRGQSLVGPGGSVANVRLKRDEAKKSSTWQWRDSPFAGTRELNGLRVVMALINNWDLKDENNAVRNEGGESIYMVSDLGASFGSASRTWPKEKSKGDLHSYERSKFLQKSGAEGVNFRTPARPSFVYLVNPREYFQRVHMEWIGRRIPRADTKWMGDLLSRLSSDQIRDAFRAAGYSAAEVEGFAAVLEKRIKMLTDL